MFSECESFAKLRDKWMLRRTKSLISSQLPKKGKLHANIYCTKRKIQFVNKVSIKKK